MKTRKRTPCPISFFHFQFAFLHSYSVESYFYYIYKFPPGTLSVLLARLVALYSCSGKTLLRFDKHIDTIYIQVLFDFYSFYSSSDFFHR